MTTSVMQNLMCNDLLLQKWKLMPIIIIMITFAVGCLHHVLLKLGTLVSITDPHRSIIVDIEKIPVHGGGIYHSGKIRDNNLWGATL